MLLNRKEAELMDAASLLVQRVFNALAAMNPKEAKKPDPDLVESKKHSKTARFSVSTLIFRCFFRKQIGSDSIDFRTEANVSRSENRRRA